MHKLQNIILPEIEEITSPKSSYFLGNYVIYRGNNKRKQVTLKKFAHLYSSSFFNAFSLDFWQKKTDIENIYLKIYGQGVAQLNIKMKSLHFAAKDLFSSAVKLTEEGITIPVGNLRKLSSTGILYFELIALSDHVFFYGGEYLTPDKPKRDIQLGIVITHFNRKNYVIPAINRISQFLEKNAEYQEKIKLVVVDNSQNITPEEAGKATVIPNKNLGGSGGFTRGLLHLEDEGSFTHCLFMDDDASCEMESITRAYHAAQFTRNEIAISGALLRDNYPDVIHEKGAFFSRADMHVLYSGLCVNNHHAVMHAENSITPIGYGGWWFFLFSLKQVKYYPYPFFVRGDDLLFSLQNRFEIATLNGVFCWGEDFSLKENPIIRFLAFRGLAIASIIYDKYSTYYILKLFIKWLVANLFSYNYDSAQALIKSMEDLQKGPNFIKENIDTKTIRKEIADSITVERMEKINKDIYSVVYPHYIHGRVKRFLAKFIVMITLNGHLLPDFLMKNQKTIIHQRKGFRANFLEVFRYQRILYENEPESTGYITTINRKRFFSLSWQAIKLSFNFILNRQELMKDFRNSSIAFTSREFWKKQYEEK